MNTDNQENQAADWKDVSLSMRQVNLMAIPVALIPAVAIVLLYAGVNGWASFRFAAAFFRSTWFALAILIGGIILHELLHGAAWAYFGRRPLTAIKFGIHWATLTPYAHCRDAMTVEAYRIGAATPAIVLGLLPSALAIFGGMHWLLFPGILFSAAAGGDLLILWLLRHEHGTALVRDHPDRAGCLVHDPQSSQDDNT
jgi:hypothetical protein